MAPKRISIYAAPALEAALDARLPQGASEDGLRSRSSTLAAIADRYAEIIRRSIPELSTAEWCLVFDAMNGVWQDSAVLAAAGIAGQIADAGPELAQKWDVDLPAFAARLQALSFAQRIAVIDTAERFWALGCEEGEEYPDIIRRLTA